MIKKTFFGILALVKLLSPVNIIMNWKINNTGISWKLVIQGRKEAREGLPRLQKIPLIPNMDKIIKTYIDQEASILDVGAGTRRLKKKLEEFGHSGIYKSLDIDDISSHDYSSFEEVVYKYDCVTLFEVIEHIRPEDVLDLFKKVYSVLKPDGKILISTPNVAHPTRFWRDCTHITPFRYDEVAGLLLQSNYRNIKVFRIKKLKYSQKILVFICRPLLKLLDVDVATTIALVAEK